MHGVFEPRLGRSTLEALELHRVGGMERQWCEFGGLAGQLTFMIEIHTFLNPEESLLAWRIVAEKSGMSSKEALTEMPLTSCLYLPHLTWIH